MSTRQIQEAGLQTCILSPEKSEVKSQLKIRWYPEVSISHEKEKGER